MKLLSKQFFILFIISASILACSDDDEDVQPASPASSNNNGNGGNNGGGTTINQDYYVFCKVDGIDFLSKDDARFNTARVFAGNQHQLRGANDTTNSVNLSLWNFQGVGTYNIPNSSKHATATYLTVNPLSTFACDTNLAPNARGKIIVTSYDTASIEGSFEFTAHLSTDISKTVSITEGKFKLKYP